MSPFTLSSSPFMCVPRVEMLVRFTTFCLRPVTPKLKRLEKKKGNCKHEEDKNQYKVRENDFYNKKLVRQDSVWIMIPYVWHGNLKEKGTLMNEIDINPYLGFLKLFSPMLFLVLFIEKDPFSLAVCEPAKDFLSTKDCLDLVKVEKRR